MKMKMALAAAAVAVSAATTGDAGVVGVYSERFSASTVSNFYDGLAGHSSSVIAGISDATLAGLDLLWAIQPTNAYTASEVAAMANFLSGGGRIAFMGEHGSYAPTENTNISAAIAALGSSMSIINDVLDGGFQDATIADGQIQSHPLTAGVMTYNYAAFAPIVIGSGSILMYGADLSSVMMAYENVGGGSIFLITDQNVFDRVYLSSNDNARMFENLLEARTVPNVPLPAAGWLMVAAFGGLGLARRKRG